MKMKTKIMFGAIVVLALFCAGLTACMSLPEGGSSSTVTIHYYRYDKFYDGWNLWVWPADPGDEGQGYNFGAPDEEGWVTGKISIPSYVVEYGYIVRKSVPVNDWDAKDIQEDRFARAKEIWVVTEDPRTYTSKPGIKK